MRSIFDTFLRSAGQCFAYCARKSAIAGLAILCLATFSACKDSRENSAVHAQMARDYLEAGNIAAANQSITEAIKLRDDNPEYFLLQGSIALRAGNPVKAYNGFDRALDLDQTNQMALAYVANLGVQIGRLKEAEAAADKLLALDSDALPGLQVKGMVALAKGQNDKADEFADRILAQHPKDEAGTILRARTLAMNNKADEAIALLDQSIETSGSSAAMLTNKLNVYRKFGRVDDMLALYEKIVPLAGPNYLFRLEQINALYKTGRVDGARQAAIALLQQGSRNAQDYATLRRIWGQYDAHPIPASAARLVAESKDIQAAVNTARYLILVGDTKVAAQIVDAVPAESQHFVASLRAKLAAVAGRQQEAKKAVDQILEKDANDVDALILRGQFYFAEGENNLALNAVQKAQAADPLNPEPYVVLAGIYEARGEGWRSKQILGEASRRLPQDYFIAERHIAMLRNEREPARVVSVATAFARAQPSATKAWAILAGQCAFAADIECKAIAENGLEEARKAYLLDDPPGTPVNRSLFGRL